MQAAQRTEVRQRNGLTTKSLGENRPSADRLPERRSLEEKKHGEDITYLTRANKQLKQQLETFLAPGKK